jgi:hypothetical protein
VVEDKVLADSIYKWSLTASANDAADSAINWRENQLPDTVNDSNRAMMMRIAEWRDDMTGALVTTGTQPAYLLTTKAVFDSLSDGRFVSARIHATNAGSPATLNVNGLGSKSIRKYGVTGDLPVQPGDLQLGGMYQFTYSSTAAAGAGGWVVSNPSIATGGGFPSGTTLVMAMVTPPPGWTKKTDNDNKALRVVSGTTGGVAAAGANFTDAFSATRTPAGTISNTVLTAAQMPKHSHTQQGSFSSGYISADHAHNQQGYFQSGGVSANHNHYIGAGFVGSGIGSNGGYIHSSNDNNGALSGVENQAHSHGTSISGATSGVTVNHYHTVTISGLTTDAGSDQPHGHTFSGAAMDFAVAYVDVIIATKD